MGVDRAAPSLGDLADRRDAFPVDGDVAREARASGAVDDRSPANDEIVCHTRKLVARPCHYSGVVPEETFPESADAVRAGLAAHDYLADEGLATSIFLALRLRRPLLLEGEAGVGKTEVAKVLARWTGGELVRLQCYEGIDASQAVYEWDYARQLLHLRAAEAADATSVAAVEGELYSERFLIRRPLLAAIDHGEGPPPV